VRRVEGGALRVDHSPLPGPETAVLGR
jgi:hypothetical protein